MAAVEAFFDETTFTVSYVVYDPDSREGAVIDSVLAFDPKSGRTGTDSADALIKFVTDNDLVIRWVMETHIHADHISAAQYVKGKLGGDIVIGAKVPVVQETFKTVFNLGEAFLTNGTQFDRLVDDGDSLPLGGTEITALAVPGHTPACTAYLVDDACFVGDTLFMPDYGTARCDFPGGDARALYLSIWKILSLPPETRLFMCHDYKAPGRDEFAWESTVAEQRKENIHVHDGVDEDAFVAMRRDRDAELEMPALLLASVQVNIRGGRFPDPEANGVSYLKIPLNTLGSA